MASIRPVLKYFALLLFAAYGWLRLRFRTTPTLLILTYHRVLPADAVERDSEQPGMMITPDTLRSHIHFIKKLGIEPIHLNEWLERNQIGKELPKLAVAFTFDDGWRDNYQYAFPILKTQKIPATIFLVTQMIGSDRTFWPEEVLRLLTSIAIPAENPSFDWLRPHLPDYYRPGYRPLSNLEADPIIASLKKKLDDETIITSLNNLCLNHPEFSPAKNSRSILNQKELSEMSKDGLITYGAHTRRHFRLNRLKSKEDLHEEIVVCFEDLQSLTSACVPVFCYPNGDITSNGESLVSDHYDAACTTKTGWNTRGCNPLDLHRFNLHDGNSGSNLALLATIGRGLL